ncbi:MAG: large subunit ribosomal protein L6 [Sphingobacteriales bacterium]|jgi:large subunit ribosomal protein L6
MSRIGKNPIAIPENVTISIGADNSVTVKGPKGELVQKVDPEISIKQIEADIVVERPSDQKRHKAMHGLYRTLISNMVEGVTNGFKTEQELVGVGYRASNQGQILDLVLGYSHHIMMQLPQEIKVETVSDKGKAPVIILESIDKQLLGQVAAKIRSLRPPEPYKGKGIRFKGEQIRRKAGKSAAKK